jgi:hypothetical protein
MDGSDEPSQGHLPAILPLNPWIRVESVLPTSS